MNYEGLRQYILKNSSFIMHEIIAVFDEKPDSEALREAQMLAELYKLRYIEHQSKKGKH